VASAAGPPLFEKDPAMDKNQRQEAYGVFKPVGHVIVSFAKADDADAAREALSADGYSDITAYGPEEMRRQADQDIAQAGVLATVGQELNLVKAHRDLAEQGYSFLVVHAPKDADAQRVADICRRHHAQRAQSYGHMIIEELISVGSDEKQVGESPARGLDAQTRSGVEGDSERAERAARDEKSRT
jgi:hypothetical protein